MCPLLIKSTPIHSRCRVVIQPPLPICFHTRRRCRGRMCQAARASERLTVGGCVAIQNTAPLTPCLHLQALSWAYVPGSKSLRTFDGWKTPSSTDMYQQIVIIGANLSNRIRPGVRCFDQGTRGCDLQTCNRWARLSLQMLDTLENHVNADFMINIQC